MAFDKKAFALCLVAYISTIYAVGPCAASGAEPKIRTVFYLDGGPLICPGPSREPISAAPAKPGIYRAFLVWRQRYAHLAICNMTMCHGSCLEYGDGCIVCAQDPVLPILLGESGNGCATMSAAK